MSRSCTMLTMRFRVLLVLVPFLVVARLVAPAKAVGAATPSNRYATESRAECWGYFGVLRKVNSNIEFNAYTQCSEPHVLTLKVNLERRNKKNGRWRDVYRASGYRHGWILNVFRERPCSGSAAHSYRMRAFPTMDGVPMPQWGTRSDPVTVNCHIRFLSGDRLKG